MLFLLGLLFTTFSCVHTATAMDFPQVSHVEVNNATQHEVTLLVKAGEDGTILINIAHFIPARTTKIIDIRLYENGRICP